MVFVTGCGSGAKGSKGKSQGNTVLTIDTIGYGLSAIPIFNKILLADPIRYNQVGIKEFDDFFQSAAKINGLVILSKGMVTSSIDELKKMAMSKAADAAMAQNIKDLVGDTPQEEWTTDQSIAVMEMAKAQGKLSNDEGKYFMTTAGSMVTVVASLGLGVKEAADLIQKMPELQDGVKKMLTNPMQMRKGKKVVDGIKGSGQNLKSAVTTIPELVKELNMLVTAFKSLS